MFTHSRLARRRVAVVAAMATLLSAFTIATAGLARADTSGSPDTTTQAAFAPTAGSAGVASPATLGAAIAGSLINIHVHHGTPNRLNSAQVRLCKPGLDIVTPSQLSPSQFGNCIPAAFSAGVDDATTNALSDVDHQNVDVSFRVGSGSQTFAFNGGSSTITCDASNPCALWIDESVSTAVQSSGHLFKHYDITYAGVPGAPGLTITPGNGELTVGVAAPANTGNAPITSYSVTVAGPGGGTQTVTPPATSAVFSGLTNFTAYAVSATATNTAANGTSHFTSAPATGSGTPVAPPPGTPSGTPGNAKVDLTWTAPSGPAPDSYEVVATPVSPAGPDVSSPSSSTSLSFTGLTNGTAYTFKVRGVYGTNQGPFSGSSGPITPTDFVATSLTATPALVELATLKLYLLTLNATLTGPGGVPIPGQPVVFYAGTTLVCTGVTNGAGTASCSGTAKIVQIVLGNGYSAVFGGNGPFLPSAAHAPLLK